MSILQAISTPLQIIRGKLHKFWDVVFFKIFIFCIFSVLFWFLTLLEVFRSVPLDFWTYGIFQAVFFGFDFWSKKMVFMILILWHLLIITRVGLLCCHILLKFDVCFRKIGILQLSGCRVRASLFVNCIFQSFIAWLILSRPISYWERWAGISHYDDRRSSFPLYSWKLMWSNANKFKYF